MTRIYRTRVLAKELGCNSNSTQATTAELPVASRGRYGTRRGRFWRGGLLGGGLRRLLLGRPGNLRGCSAAGRVIARGDSTAGAGSVAGGGRLGGAASGGGGGAGDGVGCAAGGVGGGGDGLAGGAGVGCGGGGVNVEGSAAHYSPMMT